MNVKNKKEFFEKGAVALTSVLFFLVIFLALGLAVSFSSYIQNEITSNQGKSSRAFYIAEAGIEDASQKITRNRDYENISGYELAVEDGGAGVEVLILSPPTEVMSGQTQVISTGVQGKNTKKIRVVLDIDINGKTTTSLWEEL